MCSSDLAQHLKANRSKKVVERTLRVRGLTLDDLRNHPPVAPTSEDNFQVGDLAATLVRTNTYVCLVVFQATAIRKDQSTQHIIGMETLTGRDSKYRVEGQVLHLVQDCPDLWAWLPHHFSKVSKPKKGSACHKSRTRDFTLTVQGPLCYRVNPDISPVSQALPTTGLSFGDQQTWTFHDCHLRDLTEHIWAAFMPEKVHPMSCPDFLWRPTAHSSLDSRMSSVSLASLLLHEATLRVAIIVRPLDLRSDVRPSDRPTVRLSDPIFSHACFARRHRVEFL